MLGAIAVRIGVNTGEVVAGDAARREMFASGDAVVLGDSVNVAARLEQAAAPGRGAARRGDLPARPGRGAGRAGRADRGEGQGRAADRLPAARGERARAAAAPGRRAARRPRATSSRCSRREFDRVGGAAAGWSRSSARPGSASRGSPRSSSPRSADRARIVRGACLSYGEGITYWAIAQIVRELAGIRDDDTAERGARARPAADRAAARPHRGDGDQPSRPREAIAEFLAEAAPRAAARAARRRHPLGRAGAARPARAAAGADRRRPSSPLPRPARAARRTGPTGRSRCRLEPLGAAEIDALLESLDAPAETRVRLAQAAAGNPLYAEELVAWVREGGDVDDLPTSLNALLGARLDRLEAGERDALERGAVEGELFHQGAVVELSGSSPSAVPRARRAHPQGHDPARRREPRRRAGRVPLQAHPRPRRRLPRHHQEAPRDACTSGTPTGSSSAPAIASASTTRSSATTSKQAYRYRAELGPSTRKPDARRAGRAPSRCGRRASDRTRRTTGPRRTWPSEPYALMPAENGEHPSCCASTRTRSTSWDRRAEARAIFEDVSSVHPRPATARSQRVPASTSSAAGSGATPTRTWRPSWRSSRRVSRLPRSSTTTGSSPSTFSSSECILLHQGRFAEAIPWIERALE